MSQLWRSLRWWRLRGLRGKSRRVCIAVSLLLLSVLLFCWHVSPGDRSEVLSSKGPQWSAVYFKQLFSIWTQSDLTPVSSVDCETRPQSTYPFCNPALSPQERATDLVSRLTTEELILQTSSLAPAIPRLGIKDYNWRSNCLHGWSKSGGTWYRGLSWTVFPMPVGLGASFDTSLVRKVAEVTADEGRALHNVMLAYFNGSSTEAAGLNCFSPNVNLLRDPRWGRAQETYGEDPFLISQVGVAYTRGLQEGMDPNYLKVAACAKHFAVHSGPENIRFKFKANVSLHDLFDTFLPAFKSQVLAANVAQIMPAYNGVRCKYQTDGAPSTANPYLLKSVLRKRFGASNISVVADNTAILFVYLHQRYISSLSLDVAVCMNATVDIDLGYDRTYPSSLPLALEEKKVTEASLRDAVWRSFLVRMRLGDFDPSSKVPYQLINASHLNTPENQELNLRAARESIVLLRNLLDSLPLDARSLRKLAVVGPNANATQTLLGNYEGITTSVVSVLDGIKEAVKGNHVSVSHALGCESVKCPDTSNFQAAIDIVHDANYVVMVMGLDGTVEAEGEDRAVTECEGVPQDILALPGCQTELVETIIQYNSMVILVLINGGPISLPTLFNHRGVLGIIEAFYPGAQGGRAVAEVLFGHYNPGGRMPMTVYSSVSDVPPAVSYDMSHPPGRTYRYFTGEALIPFGYGLSYTEFEYKTVMLSSDNINPCESIKVSTSVENIGDIGGDEVIQVYVQPPKMSGKIFPRIQLLGFERAYIGPSVIYVASFTLNSYVLSLVDEDGERYVFPGQYLVHVGGGGDENYLTKEFSITGDVTNIARCEGAQCLAC